MGVGFAMPWGVEDVGEEHLRRFHARVGDVGSNGRTFAAEAMAGGAGGAENLLAARGVPYLGGLQFQRVDPPQRPLHLLGK